MEELSSFAKNLKEIRKSRGLTQERLAKLLGLSSQTIINYEKDVSFPTGKGINNICEALEITSDELLGTVSLRHDSEKRMIRLIEKKSALRLEVEECSNESERIKFLLNFLEKEELDSSSLMEICNSYLDRQISSEKNQLELDFYKFRKGLTHFDESEDFFNMIRESMLNPEKSSSESEEEYELRKGAIKELSEPGRLEELGSLLWDIMDD